jgi:hypothetical protein
VGYEYGRPLGRPFVVQCSSCYDTLTIVYLDGIFNPEPRRWVEKVEAPPLVASKCSVKSSITTLQIHHDVPPRVNIFEATQRLVK